MSGKGMALSFRLIDLGLPPPGWARLRGHTPWQWGPWGVAVPGDSLQAKRRMLKIFWGWQKGSTRRRDTDQTRSNTKVLAQFGHRREV